MEKVALSAKEAASGDCVGLGRCCPGESGGDAERMSLCRALSFLSLKCYIQEVVPTAGDWLLLEGKQGLTRPATATLAPPGKEDSWNVSGYGSSTLHPF